MNNHLPIYRFKRGTQRRGVTLMEVLVSTLIMSIGVVSLATLFPISVLRSIQASQLTNAANLRYNAEAQVRVLPELINIGTEWKASTNYQPGDTVIPSLAFRRAGRPAVYVCENAATSRGSEPVWDQRERGTTDDGVAAQWRTVTLNNYVIDPLGYMLVDSGDTNLNFRNAVAGAREHFGNVGGTPFRADINRFPAFGLYVPSDTAVNNEARAASAAVLPDSWTLQAEAKEVSNLTATSILLIGVDFNELSSSVATPAPNPDLVPDRLVLYDATGRRSHVFTISSLTANANGTVVNWPASESLPTGFVPAGGRVESLERRFSYLLTVRRSFGGRSHVDCVVTFRRGYNTLDEQVYSGVFRKIDRGTDGQPGIAGNDDNGDGTTDNFSELGLGNDRPRNFVIVQYNSTLAASNNWKPFFKKGGFICDAHNLRWYRIVDVAESFFPHAISDVTPSGFELDPVASGNDRFVRLTLDQNVIEDSPFTAGTLTPVTLTIAGTDVVGGAILMRGVVDVFPLKPRAY